MNRSLRGQAREARTEVVSGALRGAGLLARLAALPFTERDAWLDEMLGIGPPPADEPELPRGAVPYLPAGVEEIAALVLDAPVRASDMVVDIGAGLGRMLIVAHLLSGARGHGVELQASLVAAARAHAAELGLTAISFEHADAAEVALDGSVFFLYVPCNGALLTGVLDRIAEVARRRPIVVGAVGLELDGVGWLVPRASSCRSLALYDSLR